MTKKDFEALAVGLKDAREALVMPGHPLPRQTVQIFDSLSRTVADVCAKQNAKFDRAKFLALCGVD